MNEIYLTDSVFPASSGASDYGRAAPTSQDAVSAAADPPVPAVGGAEGQPVNAGGGSGDTDVGSPSGFTSSAGDPSGSRPSTNACTEAGNYCTGGDNTVTLYRNPFPANGMSNALADFAINYGPLGVIGGAEEEGANLAIQLHHAFPMYLGGAAKQEMVALPAALHTAYHVTLDAALPRRLGANFYSNLGPRALGEVYDTFAAVTQKFDAEFGTNLYNAAVRNGFPGAVR